ncbi:putative bifunctional diguanylate cyclase/phosphodiesterase [Actinoplanes friuliensis]|uniref:Putative diguanylate cyclase/phosphodiesterase with PAS sensor n=1 Tax=Actinoplanes friuliensis DSM 7358 TaxID=1246995 RepID=U5W7V3_9ACTN|nr:EAL domain-containing protein [Actinoplanes friuliensis]AGZ45219.1 putative diguanylate cyclase/phosphodiesterase with PAS sensor [Actinoplanes friuliensis DSM 7358]
MPTRLAAALFGAWMVVLGVTFYAEPAWQLPVRLLAGLSAVLVIGTGIRRQRPDHRGPWHVLSAAVVLSVAGTAVFTAGPAAERAVSHLHAIGTGILLVVYLLLATVLFWFVRLRTGGRRDRGGLLDALTLTSAVALLAWTFVIGPHLRDTDLTTIERWISVAFTVGDLLCLALLTRLLTVSGRGVRAAGWLAVGILAMLLADVGFNLVAVREDLAYLAAFGRIPLYAAAGLAALSPTMAALTRPAAAPTAELGRIRLALLALASLVAPAVLVFQVRVDGEVPDLNVVAALSACTFLLVLARMAGIMGSHRLAMARERGLREASAALVSAADADEVGDAVRTAVAQLLPADVPHRVVLAMAYTEPEEPVSPETAAQSDHDRRTGTAAGLVATRDVDWAVAVRLTQFNTVLRCPLVLQDRPTGDPLVGVLHVGGPTWALLGLQRALEVLASQVALALERIALSNEVTRRNSEAYFRTLVQNTSDVILIVDDEDRVRYASPSAVHVLGGDPVGARLPDIIHPGDRPRLADVLSAVRGGEGTQEGLDFRAVGRRRTEVMLEMHCRDLRADQTVAGLVVTLRDVTERRQLERELTHQAFHDSLTGLANRVLFADRLQHALARGARDGSVVGVLFIDLDDFKIVNDTLGHAVGDQLLIAVAERISGALRADDTAARLGGDEFAALVENVQDPGAVEETATRILAALAEPIIVDGEPLQAVASIGITTTPEADTADALLRQADLALYVAKGAGKNQWRRYQSHLHDVMVERLELRSALDHAVNEGHFLLQYQPIVDLDTDEAVGFEALVRWHHPTRGVIAPDQFIEVAEESGLIVPMGRWVLDQALHTVAQWRRILPRTRQPYVSVNVSVRQFRQSGFVEQVRASLDYAGVPPQALMLEITETLLMGDDEQIWADLAVLQELGVRIAIDDFGTGYSSLSYLRQRPIDVLKIDKTFIDDMIGSEQQLALVAGIVSLAQTLNLTVVAEGIEDATHRQLLARLGCPLGQGYYYSEPLDPTEALAWLRNPLPLAAA